MKRADDFRSFMSSLRTLDESIEALPDTPGGLGVEYLQAVAEGFPVADSPYEPSGLRDGGLKIWDSTYLPMPKAASLEFRKPRDLAALRSVNAEWESTKESLNMVGRPDGVHFLRPRGPYIMDLMNDDVRMLQGAHIMTHREPADLVDDEYTFGQLSDVFLRNLVKLFLARKYGLKVNVHPEREAVDSFGLYGLEVFGSSDLRAPVLLAAAGRTSRLVPDSTVAAILGSVGVEPHPAQAVQGTKWREFNKWSCMPTLVALAGWECVDYLSHAERAELRDETFYAVPCSDLQPMKDFPELLAASRKARGEPEASPCVVTVDEWLGSEDFVKGLSVTPQLPCPHCIRPNDRAEGVVRRPRSAKPRQKLREIGESSSPELKEWRDYVSFMRNCIAIGRTATAYALGSVTAVRRRNAEFKKRTAKLKRLSSLYNKCARKASSGFVTESEELRLEIEKLRKELEL